MPVKQPTIDELREELRASNARVRELYSEVKNVSRERKSFQRAEEAAAEAKTKAKRVADDLAETRERVATLQVQLRREQERPKPAPTPVPEPAEPSAAVLKRKAAAEGRGWRFIRPYTAGREFNPLGARRQVYRAELVFAGGVVSKQSETLEGLLDAISKWHGQRAARKSFAESETAA
jgi:seryl-tRNA synthetase